MDRQFWHRIQTVFDAVAELPPAERTAFLAESCQDEPELKREVESLLTAHGDDPHFLDGQAAELVGGDLAAELGIGPDGADEPDADDAGETDPLVGSRLGHYRIEERLGAGGMGVVYRAVREDDQFQRVVALKVVKRGMDSENVIGRFRAERQILASLEHEAIAHLYDGGITDDGRPYFVMEHVDGVPIHRYCQDQDLPLTQRLALFQQVCAAVQYAHQNLVVHRDLKPSNILVTTAGRVKLLDFGIAKLLDDPDGGVDGAALTRTGLRPLTPEYASPEQVLGDRITTAVDVYGLGVLLYELLTERNPHRRDGEHYLDTLRTITETDPEPPSRTASRWRRQLRGDLDTIVLMALRKEPARRYGSPLALADDITRYLEGHPVTAHRDSLGYRLHKFVQRNRPLAAVTAIAFLVVLGFGVGMSLLAHRNARQALQIRAERDRAEETTGMIVAMFDLSDPYGTETVRGDTMRVRDFLHHHQDVLLAEAAEPTALQAEMAHLLARLNANLGLYDEALPLIEQALAIRQQLPGQSDLDLALCIDYLGTVRQGLGDFSGAETAFRQALDLRSRQHGHSHLDVAESLNNLSVAISLQDKLAEALTYDREALAIRRALLGSDHLDVAQSLNNLGASLYYVDDLDGAEPLYREALAIRRTALGDEHPYVANTMCNLARLLRDRERLEESENYFRQAIRIWRLTLGEQHPQLSTGLYNLGFVLERRGNLMGAANAFRQGNDIDRATLPARHSYIADSAYEVGRMLLASGDAAAAEPWLQEAASIYAENYGAEDEETAKARHLLTTCRREPDRSAATTGGGS
ncbi:MAG: serine/threonine-protein kinase [bacterium]